MEAFWELNITDGNTTRPEDAMTDHTTDRAQQPQSSAEKAPSPAATSILQSTSKLPSFDRTKFPKIAGHVDAFVKNVTRTLPRNHRPRILKLQGTTKLHGQHGDVVMLVSTSDINRALVAAQKDMGFSKWHPLDDGAEDFLCTTTIQFQTRNKVVTPRESHQGFPAELSSPRQHQDILDLKHQILKTYLTARLRAAPKCRISPALLAHDALTSNPLIIAGEWVGEKVQQGVALAQLPQHFVITNISLGGNFQNIALYAHIEARGSNVLNVCSAGVFAVQLPATDMTAKSPVFAQMQAQSDAAESECPYAKFRGIRGRGEGIVWTLDLPIGHSTPSLWLKMKGPLTRSRESGGHQGSLAAISEGSYNQQTKLKMMAKRLVTDRRIEQGFEYLREMGKTGRNGENARICQEWMWEDVWTEELAGGKMEALGGGLTIPQLRAAVGTRARDMFLAKYAQVMGSVL